MAEEFDPLAAKIRAALRGSDPETLKALVRGHREIEEIKKNLGPQSKDELQQWFRDIIGVEVPDVSVCPGHISQLEFFWWIYQFKSALGIFSRGWGKTSGVCWVNHAQCMFFPGFGVFAIGPGRDQGERKYEHLLPHVVEGGVIGGKELSYIIRSIQTKTQYKNTSVNEIALGGSPENANGPRQPQLHRDESELMQDATRKQAANIPAGKKSLDGRYIPAHTVDTTTMKYAGGWTDKQMEEYLDVLKDAGVDPTQMDPVEAYLLAVERGHRARKPCFISCLFEVSQENPACRSVPDAERRARLIELKRDPDELCSCNEYRSGYWDVEVAADEDDSAVEPQPPKPRTLEDVCQGRFFRSRGHKPPSDAQALFLENDRETWEAEQECSQPSREGAYIRSYSQDRQGIRGYEPDPENGPIYSNSDWGSSADAHYTFWVQELDHAVEAASYKGSKIKTMPRGSRVVYSEYFKPNAGNVESGKVVVAREEEWFLRWPGWKVFERYADNANAGAKLDWRDQCGLDIVNRIKKDFPEEVKYVRVMVGGYTFYVDIAACPVMDKALRGWRQVNGREVRNEHTHAMAALRYYAHNRHVVERALIRSGGRPAARPAAAEDVEARPREREAELAAGPRVIRHVPTRARVTIGAAGAEDSPLRTESGRLGSPDFRLTERER